MQIFGIDPLFTQKTVILQSNLCTGHKREKDKQDTGEGDNMVPNSYERCERIVLMFINREYEKRWIFCMTFFYKRFVLEHLRNSTSKGIKSIWKVCKLRCIPTTGNASCWTFRKQVRYPSVCLSTTKKNLISEIAQNGLFHCLGLCSNHHILQKVRLK